MAGGTLLKHIIKKKRLSEPDSACIIKKMLESLSYLHSLNIAHRDIKLENIFCKEDNE